MARLSDLARVVRSKNAGPCLFTFDLMFAESADYERAARSTALLRSEVARRYRLPEAEVAVIPYAPALAVKITIPRDIISGEVRDRDVYGAQQHAPLLDIEIP